MDIDKAIKIRCGGEIHVSLNELNFFQKKLKSITDKDFKKLKDSLSKDGLPIAFHIWWNPKKKQWDIMDGHHRYLALKALETEGWFVPPIPANKVIAENRKEAAKIVLISNSRYARMSQESLSDFMIDFELKLDDIELLDFADLPPDLSEQKEDEYEGNSNPDEIPEDVPTKAKLGDLFVLGGHRLLCGDSTDLATVERLMNGEKSEITFSSPPYNLGDNAKLRGYNGDGSTTVYTSENDHKSQSEYLEFMKSWTNNALIHSDIVFCNVQLLAGNKLAIPQYWMIFYENLIDLMIWDKEHAAPQMAARVLNSVFELIFIFTKSERPKRTITTGKEFRGTLQNIFRLNPVRGGKDEFQKDHGAVFPIAFAEHFIANFSENSVLELFGGSGTTLIACEKTKRKCFMMELDPHYIDVIIARWQKFTSKKAVREDGVLWDDIEA